MRHPFLALCLMMLACLVVTGCDAGAPEEDSEHCGEERTIITCPVTIIEVMQGEEVEVGTTIQLDARIAKGGTDSPLAEWKWSVLEPLQGETSFVPSPLHPNPTFTPTRPGPYLFVLHSADADGMESCSPAQRLVEVRAKPLPEIEASTLLQDVGLEREEGALEAIAPTLKDSRLLRHDSPADD